MEGVVFAAAVVVGIALIVILTVYLVYSLLPKFWKR